MCCLLCMTAFADKIPAPSPLRSTPKEEKAYLDIIYNNHNSLEVVDADPNGSKVGKKGYIILYISGTTYRLYINVDGDKVWKYSNLS